MALSDSVPPGSSPALLPPESSRHKTPESGPPSQSPVPDRSIKEQEKAVNHSLLKLREEQAGNHTEKQDGCCRDNLYGTYVHGIFDKAEVAETIVCALMKEKGMEPEVGGLSFDYEKYREEQYNRLADTMRKYLDMEAINSIILNRERRKKYRIYGSFV